jgi:hypothetical protein
MMRRYLLKEQSPARMPDFKVICQNSRKSTEFLFSPSDHPQISEIKNK